MMEEEENVVILRDVEMRIDGVVEQWNIELLTKRSAQHLSQSSFTLRKTSQVQLV